MKTITAFLLLVAIPLFISCQKEEPRDSDEGTPLIKAEDGTAYDLRCLRQSGLSAKSRCQVAGLPTEKARGEPRGSHGSFCRGCYYVNPWALNPYDFGWSSDNWYLDLFSAGFFNNYYGSCYPGYYYPFSVFFNYTDYRNYSRRSSCDY